MGYNIHQVESEFRIKAENKHAAMAAIKALAGQGSLSGYHGERRYSWINSDREYLEVGCLELALKTWRWTPSVDQEGNIIDIDFTGEKSGDDAVLFAAIAPFVEAGSYIEMQGEEGERWRWLFDGQAMREQKARLVWDA